jgi:YHS domain-containing protein
MRTTFYAVLALLVLLSVVTAAIADSKTTAKCPVTGKDVTITKTTPQIEVNGHPYYFADKASKDKFVKNPEKYMKYIVCPVTKDKVKLAAGLPRVMYKDNLYLFCCNKCPVAFNKNPEKYAKNAAKLSAQLYGNYYCPMHPDVVSMQKGTCSKCGMNLVPVEKTAGGM